MQAALALGSISAADAAVAAAVVVAAVLIVEEVVVVVEVDGVSDACRVRVLRLLQTGKATHLRGQGRRYGEGSILIYNL